MSRPKLTFLGGVGTVTGSKYLLEIGRKRLLIDCGLFQGYKQLRLRNWAPLAVHPKTISAVVLTHAHLDHSGYLPLLVKRGFRGPIYCTPATRDLCGLLLPDSGFIQEKDAEFANRHGFSKHHPALPLYTKRDAERAVKQFEVIDFDQPYQLARSTTVTPRAAGHILGAASLELDVGGTRIVFSGDLGPTDSATMVDPAAIEAADYIVVESTYGNRLHEKRDPEDALAEIIVRTAARGGVTLIAAFAVGRAQTLLYHLHNLKKSHRIPDLPIFLDSPMAVDASDLYCLHLDHQKLTRKQWQEACGVAHYVRDVEESKSLDEIRVPKVIVSASGMATGGRILHHLKVYAPDWRNSILFSGFQAGGTRGAAMMEGAPTIKIHGEQIAVNADVANLSMLSAHADADELMAWLANFKRPPRMTFITHGEPAASDTFRMSVENRLRWPCRVPEHGETITLS